MAPRQMQPATSLDVQALIQQQSRYIPTLGIVQFFWQELKSMESWWPILLPFLAWVGWRTYRKERRKVLRERQVTYQ
jgi:hypothetical protein